MPQIDLSILNQRQTPAFYADTLANRPAAGFVGRIFVSTNTYAFYRDNGTSWDLIGGPGTGTVTGSGANGQVTFWNGASSISGSNNLFWDNVNGHLGIKTITPTSALDVNHNGTLIASFNNTSSVNSLVGFKNAGNEQWWIGTENTNDDFLFYDATNFPTLTLRTTFKTSGQVLIGGGLTGSGKLVVESATSDNGIQIVGANAPSLRIDNANTGATLRIGLGISTGTNNFIQGSASGNMCVFNGSTTASPMLFGIYDAAAVNVQEAARISPARNFLVGGTVDGGQKLQITGNAFVSGTITGQSTGSTQLYLTSTGGGSNRNWQFQTNETAAGDISLMQSTTAGGSTYVKLFNISPTGAATFASSLTASAGLFQSSFTAFPLTIDNSNQGYVAQVYKSNNVTFGYIGNANTLNSGGSNTDLVVRSENNLIFSSGSSEALRIESSTKNVLIGTTTDNGKKLQVNGGIYSTYLSPQYNATNGNGGGYLQFQGIENSVVTLSTLFPNVTFTSNAITLRLQLVMYNGTATQASSCIINCIRNGGGTWTYNVVSNVADSVGGGFTPTLTFGGTNAAPTLQITGSNNITASFELMAR